MKNLKKLFVSALLVFFIITITTSCDLADNYFKSSQNTGSLVLQISKSNVSSRTILPDISMDIFSYTIIGNGPNGASFSEELNDSTTLSKNNLIKGDWTISVEAYNAGTDTSDPVLIAEGEKTITILPAVLNEKSITVTPIIGVGDFELSVSWNEALTDPSLTYTLTTASKEAVDRTDTFIISDQQGTLNIADLPNGYYVLEVTLNDNGSPVGYAADSLRIISGQKTSGTLAISMDDTGDFELSITPQMDDPFIIELSGGEESLTPGSNMTITATPSETVDSYTWYLNGLKLTGETTSSITLGADLQEGDYTLMSMVWKGNIVCSENYHFSVGDLSVISQLSKDQSFYPIYSFTNEVFCTNRTSGTWSGEYQLLNITSGEKTLLADYGSSKRSPVLIAEDERFLKLYLKHSSSSRDVSGFYTLDYSTKTMNLDFTKNWFPTGAFSDNSISFARQFEDGTYALGNTWLYNSWTDKYHRSLYISKSNGNDINEWDSLFWQEWNEIGSYSDYGLTLVPSSLVLDNKLYIALISTWDEGGVYIAKYNYETSEVEWLKILLESEIDRDKYHNCIGLIQSNNFLSVYFLDGNNLEVAEINTEDMSITNQETFDTDVNSFSINSGYSYSKNENKYPGILIQKSDHFYYKRFEEKRNKTVSLFPTEFENIFEYYFITSPEGLVTVFINYIDGNSEIFTIE